MTSKSSARIVVDIGGVPKPILSIGMRNSGDVVIRIKSAQEFRVSEMDSTSLSERLPNHSSIIEQRYSVHLSKNSPLGVDTLKHTLRTARGEITTVQYTRAIRSAGFAHLFSQRHPDLRHPHHKEAPTDKRNHSLCRMDPTAFTLMTNVFIGGVQSEFIAAGDDFNHYKLDLGVTRIVVVWSFLPLPSHSTGLLSHGITVDPDGDKKIDSIQFNERVRGFTNLEIVMLLKHLRDNLRKEMVLSIKRDLGNLLNEFPFEDLGYFKHGDGIGEEFTVRAQAVKLTHDIKRAVRISSAKQHPKTQNEV